MRLVIIRAGPGCNIPSTLRQFSNERQTGFVILGASGRISNFRLSEANSFAGHFRIGSMMGTLTCSGSWEGKLTVIVSDENNSIISGVVDGWLIAETTVSIAVGVFSDIEIAEYPEDSE